MTPGAPGREAADRRRGPLAAVLAVLVLGALVLGAVLVLAVGPGSGSPDLGPRASPPVAHPAGHPSASPSTAARPVAAHQPAPAMARSVPTRLRIPAIGVDSDLMSLGLESDGTLQTPPGPFPAGWFTGGPTPGELGPAIIAGHVRYDTPGVFAHLARLRSGDLVLVDRADGSTATFRVREVEHVAKASFPTRAVYGNLDHAGLRLITCAGLDARSDVFAENLVVFADLVTS